MIHFAYKYLNDATIWFCKKSLRKRLWKPHRLSTPHTTIIIAPPSMLNLSKIHIKFQTRWNPPSKFLPQMSCLVSKLLTWYPGRRAGCQKLSLFRRIRWRFETFGTYTRTGEVISYYPCCHQFHCVFFTISIRDSLSATNRISSKFGWR